MARVYLKFTKEGTFKHEGGCSVDVDEPINMDEIWARAHDQMFTEYIVRDREYDADEWKFELVAIKDKDGNVIAND